MRKSNLNAAQIQQFKIDGYLILPSLMHASEVSQLRKLTEQHLSERVPPFELEADVRYPGAPRSRTEIGGTTIRRLLMAYQRDNAYLQLARHPNIIRAMQQILDSESLFLNPNHHNCVMTKQPTFSSETLWHRDTRYWNFDNKYLINAWSALGDERRANGGMKILPGSHRWEVQDDALDEAQFLKLDHPYNQDRLATQRLVDLSAGDTLLFSAHCFHAAGINTSETTKYSVVFTYHSEANKAIEGTHSASTKEIQVP